MGAIMAAAFPYAHYACPCSDSTGNPVETTSASVKRASILPASSIEASLQIDQDRAFNSHDPRANYTLYPLDQLLYCDECDAVRCPRCWTEEVLYWYCPSCLFEVPSSGVRGDGNRCCRSCYDCPSCTSSLAIVALPTDPSIDDGLLKPGGDSRSGESYILQCQYCEWNSLSLDMQFSMPKNITGQMVKLRKARGPHSAGREAGTSPTEAESIEKQAEHASQSHDSAFANMVNFYKGQLNESTDLQNPLASSPYSSPANLARIMSLYGGLSYSALKKSREKSQPMREVNEVSEGLRTYTIYDHGDEGVNNDAESEIIEKMQAQGWDRLSSHAQRVSAPANYDAKFTSDLWPAATPLRTRRGRRCNVCRQFLARPDPKVSSMRYRIRLLAVNFLPRLSMKPLAPSSVPLINPAFQLRKDATSSSADEFAKLKPGIPKQYILTLRNPIFETVHITLATPTTTPGRVASRVTILCPSFDVGPAGDVWDEALTASSTAAGSAPVESGGRTAAMASLTGARSNDATGEPKQPEAGKVWERTRNSTSVIVEVVPGSTNTSTAVSTSAREPRGGVQNVNSQQQSTPEAEGVDDDDVLEVPVYVRAEWEAEVKEGESSMGKKDVDRRSGEKVRKELGYWVVLGLGKIVG